MADTTITVNEPAPRVRRVFEFNGAVLADPDPTWSPDEVKKMYAGSGYPALTNSSLTGPIRKENRDVYTFKAAVGTKG